MGGDLNLKKSWHPVLLSNQRRLWEEEKKALDERKRVEQMLKERQEERNVQEIQEMQEAAGGTKRLNRVEWMYSGPAAGQSGTTEEMEGYLLGKRRIDGLIKGTENKKLEKGATEESFMGRQNANTVRDTASKIREDPMLAIKKQEQAAYRALMNDPVRQRLLLKAAGIEVDANDKVKERRRHRHHHHQNGDDRRRDRKRRRIEDEDHHWRRARSRPSSDRRGSPSPYCRSRSPPHHYANGNDLNHSRSVPDYRPKPRRRSSSPNSRSPLRKRQQPLTAEEKAARLVAMGSDANELDAVRSSRLAALEQREVAERKADQEARDRSSKYGGKGDFVHSLNRKAGEMDIGERMKRGRGDLEKGLDAE